MNNLYCGKADKNHIALGAAGVWMGVKATCAMWYENKVLDSAVAVSQTHRR